jgi:3-hydroxyacyl-[acyl-carrier-protein] dehydratase
MEIIPHRDPFLLIDEVTELGLDNSVTAVKHVTGNEDFFRGHFPGYPVMPGVLVLEAMAQAGAVVILGMPEYKGKIALFAGADDVRWRKEVKPGDTLTLKVKLEKIKFGMGVANGEAYVGDTLACSAVIKFAVAKN